MIGTTLAHYRITAALGAGGMGEVWRATDTKLGRDVALKVLPQEFAEDAGRLDRFEREARAVASLNHPHIVTIYSVEDADGIRFLTMELVEGKTLDGMIPEGGFDLQRFFELATPLAEAISAAHDKSVIHRDLKPSNVMVDGEGRVKVLDFGLAKLQQPEGVSNSTELPTEALTGVGTIVGTMPYMSPEQVEGKIVDHRTDVFSLGVLLYEMATGERPFRGGSSPALMSSILRDVPPSVVEMRDDLPRHLGRIVTRCLEKDRRDRYQTARDVFNELKALRRESASSTGAAAAAPTVASVPPKSARPSSDISVTGRSSAATASMRRDDGFWVAVMPFVCRAADASVEALADGLTEDVVTGLSRFSYLRVIARSSTSRYADQAHDVRAVGEELGARYVMEGSVRQAGPVLRVAVQLVDAESGAHLWAETYNRPFTPEGIFDLQDDLAPRIVSTVADMNGVLPHTMGEMLRARDPRQLTPYEALLLSFAYYERLAVEDHSVARDALERAVHEAPDHADCWALLSMLYAEEYKHGFNVRPDSLDRALEAARRAVACAPSNNLAYHMLAQAHFFRREFQAFRNAADRAVALNPMDGCTTAFMGILMAYTGDWDHGCALAERAMQLNPHHPGWYRFSLAANRYRSGDYEGALDVALKINMPSYYFTHSTLAAVYGQLGQMEAARAALRELIALKPNFAEEAREEWGKWFGDGELLERLIDGLRKAGLEIGGVGGEATDVGTSQKTAASDSFDAVAIAVLPFTDMSPEKDQDYFCEGMAEEIMNALVHVEGIRVASRTSAFRAIEEGNDLKAIGRVLSVGQVLEGSVRMAGSRLRVTAQLTEIESGYQLWSERYDREAADVFAIQDEIAAGVVEAVTSRLDTGVRSLPSREKVANVEAYRHYLKGRHYRYSKNDHANALRSFEAAVALDPGHGPSWVGKAEVTTLAAVYSLIPAREAYQTAKDALETASRLQGESAESRYVEGMISLCEARWRDSESALRRAIEIQPSFVQAHCWLGFAFSVQYRLDEAERAFEIGREFDPLAAYPYAMTACGLLATGRPKQAIAPADQAMTFESDNTLALYCSGIAKVATGEFEEGLNELEAAVRLSRRGSLILGVYGWGLAAAGRRAEAETVLEELRSRPKPAPTAVTEAWILAALGDGEGAFKILARAEEELQGFLYFAGMAPFDPLRSDPRFDALLERLGLPPSLSTVQTGGAANPDPSSEKSIAVLPFVNMSADRENEYFSDGLSEEIINALTRLPGLRVIARTSAFRFRGEQDLRKVGEALGVGTLLEGSVRKAGQKLRITAQLIDVADDSHIWSERFDRELVDVFAIQDEIAAAIVEKLHVSLGTSEPARRQTANVAAYEALLEGRHHFSRFTPESTERALVCFRRALTLDPEYPDALAFSAFYHLTMAYMFENPREMLPNTREFGERALRVDPHHGEAQAAVAVVSVVLDHDWSVGEVLFRKALELAPASARVHELYGLCWLLGMGRFDEALAELDLAIELDPLSALYAGNRGRVLTCARRFDEAQESCRRGLTLDSRQLLVQVELIYALLFDEKLQEAIAVGERAIETHGTVNAPCQALALSYAMAGRRDEAFALVDETAGPGAGYRSPLALGLVYAAFDEMDAAFACVEQSFEERDPLLMYLAVHPMFDNLRGDPRYSVLLRRMNLSEVEAPTKPEAGGFLEPVAPSKRRTVGRLSELESLRGALEEARNGRGSLMCVAGEPGIGKTTLVEEFLSEAVVDGGCAVARGRSSERIGGSDAYLPILEALDSLLQSSEGEAAEPIIKRVAPAWYAQFAPLSDESDESVRLLEQVKETTQERLKLDFVACVQELSRLRPLVLFLDDLHWADESTVDLLSFLAGKFEGSNVLVVVTYRPSDMQLSKHPFLQIKPDLQTRGVCREIQLGFLHEAEIAEYLDLEFPGHGFPPEFPALIHEKTEGSPLFMADVVRYLRDQGAIGQVDGGWRLIHGLPEIERQLPESVLGMIERKIGQLDEADHELLTVASVQGYEFDSAIAGRVLGVSPEETEERLEDLERVHAFVTLAGEAELPDRTLTLRYRFVHVLYQNSLYGSLKPTRRARLSREVGEALETAHGRKIRPVAHELAALFEVGRDFSRAAKYYLMAAGQANAVFAHREAATLAHQGLGMVERLDPSPERSRMELELQLALGLAMRSFRGFGHPDTGTAYKRARALCHEIGDAPQLFPVLFGLWEFFQNQGDLEAAVDVAEQMLGLAEKGDDQGLLVAAHSVMADNLVCIGDPVPASEHAARALALYEPDEHQSLASLFGYDSAVSAHSMGALALWLAGYPEQALRQASAGAALSDTFSDPATQAFGPCFASWIRQLTGSAKQAKEQAEKSIEIASRFELPMFQNFARICNGLALISQQEFEPGTEVAREGVDGLEVIEFGWARSFTLSVIAQGCAGMGRYDEALTLVDEAFDHVAATGEHFYDAELHRLKGEFLLSSEPRGSERCFTSAIEVAQRQQAKSWELRATTSLARLWRDEGRIAEAQQKLEQIYSWFTEGFETSDLKAAKALLEEMQAALPEKGEEPPSSSPHREDSTESKSIVVLPFANLSPDADTEYFSDGLTDEIITDLSRVRALRVISRSSAMRLKGDPRGLAAIGRDLGCRFVLEGSVRRSANDLRITARLVDAPNDAQLWADKYAGTLDDVFDFQERVSRSIVDALEIRMTPQEEAQLAERPIDDVRAQESYLRARNEIWSFMPGGLDLAISHLESALELIGDNALIYQGLGEAYFQYVNIGAAVGREEEFIGNAEDCVDKIFALEPESPRGHLVRAQTQMARGEIHACAASLQRVLMAYPNEVMALALYTHVLGWLGGKPDVAAPVAARLATVDPLNPMSLLVCAMVPLFAGRFSEAVDAASRMFALDPVTPVWRSNYVMALCYARRFDEAESLTEALKAEPDSDVATWQMGLNRAAWREDRAEVLRLADGPYRQVAEWDAEIPWFLATAHAAVGANEEALHWLDRAIDAGMINYPFLSEHDWLLDNIRGESRFDQAMERARREWERLDEVLP